MRIHSVAALLIAVSSLLANAYAAESAIAIQDPYVRLVPPGIKATGGFMLLRNSGATDRQLIKAASPIAGVVELHTHLNENGVMKMREVPRIEIKAHGQTELKPGSFHVMLIDLKEPLRESGTVPITLEFDDGSTYRVLAPIRKPHVGMPEHKAPHSGMPGH